MRLITRVFGDRLGVRSIEFAHDNLSSRGERLVIVLD